MKIIRNSLIPLGKDYGAINLFGIIFAKKNMRINPQVINHESIHTAQMIELLFIPFYIMYLVEWIFLLIKMKGNTFQAYKNISFEREAYDNHSDLQYLKHRRRFSQWRRR